eukprot:4951430-Ditylum_brightwellii.AAC.1
MNSLLKKIRSYGVNASLEPYETTLDHYESGHQSCNWLSLLKNSNHETVRQVLQAIKPSKSIANLIDANLSCLLDHVCSSNSVLSDGVCLHDRNGHDWHKHCEQWEGIVDRTWRKKCLNDQKLPLHELVQIRIPDKDPKSWIYYIGDIEPSVEMILDFKNNGMDIVHRGRDKLLHNVEISRALHLDKISVVTNHDVFAAIDFFTCFEIESFIGNSVSAFSASQIAVRGGMNSSWYNSQSIPLSTFFNVFNVPIVYTYTEESSVAGQHLLKASILSVRGAFGMSTNIHILYHGVKDNLF